MKFIQNDTGAAELANLILQEMVKIKITIIVETTRILSRLLF